MRAGSFVGVLVLLEAWFANVANRTLLAVNFFNVSVEDATFKVLDLFARIYFAEVSKVVEADEFVRCFSHGVDIEPAFSTTPGG